MVGKNDVRIENKKKMIISGGVNRAEATVVK